MRSVDIAKRIRKAREEARLSQVDLAKAIGVSDKSVSAYEKGRAMPPFNKLKKIASQTNHSVSYFVEENTTQNSITKKLASIESELKQLKKLLRKPS